MDFLYILFLVGISLKQFVPLSLKLGVFWCLRVNLKVIVNDIHDQCFSEEAGV